MAHQLGDLMSDHVEYLQQEASKWQARAQDAEAKLDRIQGVLESADNPGCGHHLANLGPKINTARIWKILET